MSEGAFKEINEKYEKYINGTLTEEDCKPTEAAKKFLDIKKQLEDLEKSEMEKYMLPTSLNPMGDRLLLEVEEEKEISVGGILIPATVQQGNDLTGKVLFTGAGEKNKDGVVIDMTVKVGDKVLFPKSLAQDITINGKKYFIVKEKDVYGVLE
jgi:chaperonin GroES